ncbi:MAG: hemerythrin domain-containing protein [Rubrivivax sp.]
MSQVSQTLDTEHRAALDVLGRLEQACSRRLPLGDAEFAILASAFVRLLEHDTATHFDFEEQELFPRMAEAGEGDIVALLTEEHVAIREAAAELLPLAREVAAGTLAAADFDAFKRGVQEVVERQVSHIQKETMALLPSLDDLLDDETDRALSMAYATA